MENLDWLHYFLIFACVVAFISILIARSENNQLHEQLFRIKDDCNKKEKEIKKLKESNNSLAEQNNTLESKLWKANFDNSQLEKKYNWHIQNLNSVLTSHLSSFPWLSGMMGDFLTYDIEAEAKALDWGYDSRRMKKVATIREIRAEAKERIEASKIAQYQLEYLKQLFPSIEDVLESEYAEIKVGNGIPERDSVREYLSKEEWKSLSVTERNQLALDRYIKSHSKSKWQIGRDYELAIAYEYSQKGFSVDTYGSYMGLSDMGRDIIAKKQDKILIIQCKFWSKEKTIHEKHIYQLYGTTISYCIEHKLPLGSVNGVFVTNIELSPVARSAATMLGIRVAERHPMVEYPRIKCNIGHDESGRTTKIYHLPMDEQYDSTKIDSPGECYAFTVAEAEEKGFRRAYKYLH